MAFDSKRKKSQSPYQKYGKTPFRYSDLYQNWRQAIGRGDDVTARRYARLHFERFGHGFVSNDRLAA